MGYNTTVVVINDALDQIEKDPNFGKNLASAIREAAHLPNTRVDVPAGNHCNAAQVVECHHADQSILVTVGGNMGLVQARTYGFAHHTEDVQKDLLLLWADKLGYALVKKDANVAQ